MNEGNIEEIWFITIACSLVTKLTYKLDQVSGRNKKRLE
jgi:hypothetical protein